MPLQTGSTGEGKLVPLQRPKLAGKSPVGRWELQNVVGMPEQLVAAADGVVDPRERTDDRLDALRRDLFDGEVCCAPEHLRLSAVVLRQPVNGKPIGRQRVGRDGAV